MKLSGSVTAKTFVLSGLLAASLNSGCTSSSGSSPGASETVPEATAGYKAANVAIAGADGMVPNTLSLTSSRMRITAGLGSSGDIWNTAFLPDPRCSGGGSDPHCGSGGTSVGFKGYMGFMSDASAVRDNGSSINIFGRLKKAMETGCAISTLLSRQNGGTLPTSGTFSVTFTTEVSTMLAVYCWMTDMPSAGTTVDVVVTPTTDTTHFDRKITLNMGSQVFTTYLRATATELNVAESDNNSPNFSRTWVKLNRATGAVRAEYASYSSNSGGAGEFHRLYFDPANQVGAMVGASFDFNSSPNRIIFSVKGKPEVSGAETAFSMSAVGFGLDSVDTGASTSALNHYKGCVNADDGTIVSGKDNTVSCGGGVTGYDTSTGLATAFTSFLSDLDGNGAGLIHSGVFGETHSLGFMNATDIFTAAIAITP